jgi:alpha-galactosidase
MLFMERREKPCGVAPVGRRRRLRGVLSACVLLAAISALPRCGRALADEDTLAATPPMGWNDWAHYQCNFTAGTILDNARALVKTGLAGRGYNAVTIDDCWMGKERDAKGDLQVDPGRFPQGMASVVKTVHELGLRLGIYEDAGYATCGGFAGSGEPKGGGADHFRRDAELFSSWGVDYLKLDGCNVYVPRGETMETAYRNAYAAESEALRASGRAVVFSESAPAYFEGTPQWYDVLQWVKRYGQLWREGDDIATFDPRHPGSERFHSVLWNYAYNLPLARFQRPGNWNDADFIIGGDPGMTAQESRSQMALWSMMSAPLILSSDLTRLSPEAIAILGNRDVIAVDQDALGEEATLVRRTPATDLLFKGLSGDAYAVALLNRGTAPVQARIVPQQLGFAAGQACRIDATNLWNGAEAKDQSVLRATVPAHDTAIWRIRANAACGAPARTGVISMVAATDREPKDIGDYGRCLAAGRGVVRCAGTAAEHWTVTAAGELKSGGKCLTEASATAEMRACNGSKNQRWQYTPAGNLIGEDQRCLSASGPSTGPQQVAALACGHNLARQIWSLPGAPQAAKTDRRAE